MTRPKRSRIILTIILLVIVIGAISLFLILEGIRTAPLQLGRDVTPDSDIPAEVTPEIVADTIPFDTPPDEITFLSNRNGTWDVYLMQPDGMVVNLSVEPPGPEAEDYFGSWSMDSNRVNFLSNRTGEMGPTQVEPDGSNPQELDILTAIITLFGEGRLDWDAAWSPGGEKLIWSSLRDINLELYTIDTDDDFISENAIRLTTDSGRDWFPAWSPDGINVSFSSDREGNENIYIVDTETTELTQLTDDEWDELHAVWSLDGSQILYIYDEDDLLLEGVLTLNIMDADGGNQRRFDDNELFEGDPTWSRDGSHTMFMSNRGGDWNLYIMNADGTNIRRLTHSDADDLYPVWRP